MQFDAQLWQAVHTTSPASPADCKTTHHVSSWKANSNLLMCSPCLYFQETPSSAPPAEASTMASAAAAAATAAAAAATAAAAAATAAPAAATAAPAIGSASSVKPALVIAWSSTPHVLASRSLELI